MDPIIAPMLISMLAKEGLNLLSGVIKGGGKKAAELITKETGIDIVDIADPSTETVLTPEQKVTLQEYEFKEVTTLAEIVASADANKAPGIVVAAIASELPEMFLFLLGLFLVGAFAIWGEGATAGNLASAWLGAFAMYVKGK